MEAKNLFKSLSPYFLPLMIFFIGQTSLAQEVPTTQMVPDTANMAYNEISKKLGFYVFPGNEETQLQQKEDEYACYLWAIEQSGIDPLDLPTVEAAPVQSGPTGGAVKGAALGYITTIMWETTLPDSSSRCKIYMPFSRNFPLNSMRFSPAGRYPASRMYKSLPEKSFTFMRAC